MRFSSVLFLDFDDVLNTSQTLESGRLFERENIDALNHLLDQTDLGIVITSMWRIGATQEELEELLLENGAHVGRRVIGRTPYLEGESRGSEIRAWISDFGKPVEEMVILDNRDDMDEYTGRLVRTSPSCGLHHSKAMEALSLLGHQ